MDKLIIQNLDLCINRFQSGIIQKHDRFPLVKLIICFGNIQWIIILLYLELQRDEEYLREE